MVGPNLKHMEKTCQTTSKAVLFNWQLIACFETSSNIHFGVSCVGSNKVIQPQDCREKVCFNQKLK